MQTLLGSGPVYMACCVHSMVQTPHGVLWVAATRSVSNMAVFAVERSQACGLLLDFCCLGLVISIYWAVAVVFSGFCCVQQWLGVHEALTNTYEAAHCIPSHARVCIAVVHTCVHCIPSHARVCIAVVHTCVAVICEPIVWLTSHTYIYV